LSENLVEIDDLDQLDASDLRAVFAQVEPERVATALTGLEPGLRRRLLGRLPRDTIRTLDHAQGAPSATSISAESVLAARRSIVEVLCGLARRGQIAFDHPEDILDLVA
jgi:flagellar motor switch protein FliG